MCKDNSNNPGGFTLIEALVAAALLAFLAIGVLSMTTLNISNNSYVQHHTKTVQLAESGMEELRRVDYVNQLPGYNGLVQDFGSIPNYPQFRRTFEVEYGAEISTLRVLVSWRRSGDVSRPLTLVSQRVAP